MLTFKADVNLPRAEVLRRFEEKRTSYKQTWREGLTIKPSTRFFYSQFSPENDRYRVRFPTWHEQSPAFLYFDEAGPDRTTLRLEHEVWSGRIFVPIFSAALVALLAYAGFDARELELRAILIILGIIGTFGAIAILGFWLYIRIKARWHSKAMEAKLTSLAADLVG